MWGIEASTIVALLVAAFSGGALSALITWFKDRKRDAADVHRNDVETKLAYLNGVIDHLTKDAERARQDRDQMAQELHEERQRSTDLRARVRQLEDELHGVRRSARETELRCDDLSRKIQELIDDTQDNNSTAA